MTIDNAASDDATVIDVETRRPHRRPVRHRARFRELDLDVRSAKVQTLGVRVLDAFYVRDRHGSKIVDRETLDEIERAILHNLNS